MIVIISNEIYKLAYKEFYLTWKLEELTLNQDVITLKSDKLLSK